MSYLKSSAPKREIIISHFSGIHVMQALTIIAAGAIIDKPAPASLFAIGAVAYAVLTASLLYRVLSVKRATEIETRQELK